MIGFAPEGQPVEPVVHGTLLSPVVMSWNALGFDTARAYIVGLMFPKPPVAVAVCDGAAWLRMATIPAKAGAPTEVPPTGDKSPALSRNPLEQLVAVEPVNVTAAC